MAENLIVKQGTQVILNETPPQALSGALEYVKINKLQDLVDADVVSSKDTLEKLLHSAQTATASVINLRDTYTPMVIVPGTKRPDLRRFGAFRAAAPEVSSTEAAIFWRVVRDIEPTALASVTTAADITMVPAYANWFQKWGKRGLIQFRLKDVEVEPNAKLVLGPAVNVFRCRNLKIYKGGQIVVQGNAIWIHAFSIQGNI